jgi:hypothetical protein
MLRVSLMFVLYAALASGCMYVFACCPSVQLYCGNVTRARYCALFIPRWKVSHWHNYPTPLSPPPPPHTLWQAQALAAGSAELRESAFFRNSVASQHGAESFYCECNPTVDSNILTLPPAVAVLCVLGSAAAAHLAQPAQWTSARLYAAAAALAVSLFGIQQL